MNASPADQRRLLDLADLDVRIRQADQMRKSPPQGARVQELLARRQQLSQELTVRLGARDDLRTEISRLESDVSVVDARIARDQQRLAGSSNTKEVAGFESELTSLAKRKSDLEDVELELMDRLEQADTAVAEQEALIAATNAEGAELSAEAKRVVAEATASFEQATRDRGAVAAGIDAALLAMYDRVAARGVGAGLLQRNTCEGCRMVLSGTDMNAIRQAKPDAVVTCPECGCILVRTEESGL
ncbi:zinc ribbon domain-containing protein [Microbacterium sp. RU33B]|uniref:zinc ribbon domain-containing protein n=1 Tax=Microbacterium sp. RU33B TaxID=1907390 RepID=UPI00095E56AF|nr:C4-type zinc ribbon domain-containing protein [Microbacterium sp. RU33B]SIT74453.1 hypothetical protein SAMN05880545_1349 [Microbacterium sp. RU33B]